MACEVRTINPNQLINPAAGKVDALMLAGLQPSRGGTGANPFAGGDGGVVGGLAPALAAIMQPVRQNFSNLAAAAQNGQFGIVYDADEKWINEIVVNPALHRFDHKLGGYTTDGVSYITGQLDATVTGNNLVLSYYDTQVDPARHVTGLRNTASVSNIAIYKLKVNSVDTTPGYLDDELLATVDAGVSGVDAWITKNVQPGGANSNFLYLNHGDPQTACGGKNFTGIATMSYCSTTGLLTIQQLTAQFDAKGHKAAACSACSSVTVTIPASGGGTDILVKTDANDTTAGYLSDELQATDDAAISAVDAWITRKILPGGVADNKLYLNHGPPQTACGSKEYFPLVSGTYCGSSENLAILSLPSEFDAKGHKAAACSLCSTTNITIPAKVKVDSSDTLPGYLDTKITATADAGISAADAWITKKVSPGGAADNKLILNHGPVQARCGALDSSPIFSGSYCSNSGVVSLLNKTFLFDAKGHFCGTDNCGCSTSVTVTVSGDSSWTVGTGMVISHIGPCSGCGSVHDVCGAPLYGIRVDARGHVLGTYNSSNVYTAIVY